MSRPMNVLFRSVRTRIPMLALVCAGATCPIAAQVPEYVRINFQELTEGDSITDQYAAFGVYFSLADGPGAATVRSSAPAHGGRAGVCMSARKRGQRIIRISVL